MLKKAINGGEKIGVLIDPDVDGQFSAALIVKFLLRFTNNLAYFFMLVKDMASYRTKKRIFLNKYWTVVYPY